METEYKLGEYVKKKRIESGKTILQVETESGVPDSTYKRIANGTNSNTSFGTAVALVKAVGGSVDELVGIPPRVASNDFIAMENEGLRKQIELLKRENDNLNKENGAKTAQMESYDRLLAEKEKAKEWLKKIIIILAIVCAAFVLIFVGLYIYDITHLDRGFFQQEVVAGVTHQAREIVKFIGRQ